MTTASEIVDQAFRESNLVAVGTLPTDAERTEGLARLNNFMTSLLGNELGENLRDWPVPPATTSPVPARYPLKPIDESLPADVWPYPPPNVRLLVKLTSPATIYLPSHPDDGARLEFRDVGSTADITIDANGRLIEFVSLWPDHDPASLSGRKWLYRADLASWVRIDAPLTFEGESFLPPEFDDLLITGLAMRLAPRYSNEPLGGTVSTFQTSLARLRRRYKQEQRMPLSIDGDRLSSSPVHHSYGHGNFGAGGLP